MNSAEKPKRSKKQPKAMLLLQQTLPTVEESHISNGELGIYGKKLEEGLHPELALKHALIEMAVNYQSHTREELVLENGRKDIDISILKATNKRLWSRIGRLVLAINLQFEREGKRKHSGYIRKELYVDNRKTIRKAFTALEKQNGRPPTNDQVVEELNNKHDKDGKPIYPRMFRGKVIAGEVNIGTQDESWSPTLVKNELRDFRQERRLQPLS
jgi:hypothetical protein